MGGLECQHRRLYCMSYRRLHVGCDSMSDISACLWRMQASCWIPDKTVEQAQFSLFVVAIY